MDKRIKNITKDKLNRLIFIKSEFKKIIIKSVRVNKAKSINKTIFTNFLLSKLDKRASISRQYNTCVIRGRIGGVYKKFQICRHAMVKLGTEGSLQNTKISSW